MPGGENEPPVQIACEDLEDLDDFDSLTGFGDDVEAHGLDSRIAVMRSANAR